MKKLVIAAIAVAAFAFTASAKEKEITLEGEGACAKCVLKEKGVTECTNAITVEKNGKKVTYFLAKNDVSNGFHKTICSKTAKVKATGTVKEVDGKKELTVSKIEAVK